jgi:hypothetical protein
LPPPCTAWKVRPVCEIKMIGTGLPTSIVTGITSGGSELAGEFKLMVPLYTPAASEPGVRVTVRDAGVAAEAVPFAGVTASQAPPADVLVAAANERLPLPELEIEICAITGFPPFCTWNESGVVSAVKCPVAAAVTVKVTAMLTCGGLAYDDATVTVP